MSQPNPYASPGSVDPHVERVPEPTWARVLSRLQDLLLNIWPMMLGVLVVLCLPWQLLLSFVIYTFLEQEEVMSLVYVSLLGTFGQLTVQLLAEALVIAAAWQHLQKETLDVSAAIGRGLRGFVAVFPSMLLSFMAISAAMILCIFPGVYLNIRWMFALPIAVAEGRGGLHPLQKSWEITEPHFFYSMLMFALFCIPLVVVMVVTSLPSALMPEIDHWVIDGTLTTVGDLFTLIVCCGFTVAYYELLLSQVVPATALPQSPHFNQ
ncbi:Membrane domain of glycerophosphoryl diester phosphodiesterase [Anatilimnocola aggregata]|uniref:Membrane domain of glycerophosphoryl diester phosphodiesterase n=1 Tax=Anatilimnocola aggregata TaxID=2528021 RepID=A0A517YBA2_9BACT|nr:glycerophosphoryl diester phosphodiesterase membrane domain-containing protein [Anatilimnocola aggregata]QDU27491.1 Membrane domain of glycerophosphoryl diester phosphodiesterase [Anatilimnocola aggregata]